MPLLASIPSPSQGVWNLGPIPIRAYALCIVLGVIVAVWIGERRWRARGGAPGTVTDLAVWAVPFGLVGGRLYHVITDWQLYFGADAPKRPVDALFIWEGGLGIWGAIALGALGVYIGCRRRGISFTAVADTLAPGIAVAQAIGRWGNYFNQELFGGPTDLPWGLRIDPGRPGTVPGVETYHPTFLYESLWDLALAGVLVLAGRRFGLRYGRLFALYVAGYTLGRFWVEGLRVDPAHHVLGLRLNQWTSIVIFLLALAYFWVTRDKSGDEPLGVTAEPAGGPADGDADPAHQRDQADESDLRDHDEASPGGDRTSGDDPGGAAAALEGADGTARDEAALSAGTPADTPAGTAADTAADAASAPAAEVGAASDREAGRR
ncbi:prolipoprotein diacylglyceryl transferase [Microbispora sp. ATCC PTA-5024]|uniref:prolipoprotein diacylglyceryl transferase n=1 Tax=Microbispora sp. ATCC PTA-5024 TaxID=316330 RepID=UPI0003DC934E|nr:prolipoprotein diacylglyceryl transferase [Microbispora sp. ATCC PTA-5024]ETK36501.1 prolipoprotein diacylglyceryl transferase [Microbispora sp. ATCC PTA-5024]